MLSDWCVQTIWDCALACPSPRCTDEAPGRGCRCAGPPTSRVTRAEGAAATRPSWRRARGPTGPRSRTWPPPPRPRRLPGKRGRRGEAAANQATAFQQVDPHPPSPVNSNGDEKGGLPRRGNVASPWLLLPRQPLSTKRQKDMVWECECVGESVKVRGRGVPSSLVWVSVPASGSVSSRAPGSLNGLSLQGEERIRTDKLSIQRGNKGRRTRAQQEAKLLHRIRQNVRIYSGWRGRGAELQWRLISAKLPDK